MVTTRTPSGRSTSRGNGRRKALIAGVVAVAIGDALLVLRRAVDDQLVADLQDDLQAEADRVGGRLLAAAGRPVAAAAIAGTRACRCRLAVVPLPAGGTVVLLHAGAVVVLRVVGRDRSCC